MKNIFITFIVSLVFIIGGCGQNKEEIDACEIPSTIVVHNFTRHEGIDDIVADIIFKVLEYDTMEVVLLPMDGEDIELYGAYIEPNVGKDHSYLISVNPFLSSSYYLPTLMHELAHLRQFESKELIKLDQSIYIYKGDTLNVSYILPPTIRPFEKDAYNEQNDIFDVYIKKICNCK